jgi:hypothetical protein
MSTWCIPIRIMVLRRVGHAADKNEAALAKDPNGLLAQIRLEYLYEQRGNADRAKKLWAGLK